jgi:hypothetical protein
VSTSDAADQTIGAGVSTKALMVGVKDSSGNVQFLSLDGSGNLKVVSSGSAGNAAASLTGSAVPTSADYIGFNSSGNLVGVSTSAPLPVAQQGSVAVTGTFWQATQPISGTITANAGTGNFTVIQGTAASLNATVVGTGTFAVQSAQSGSWTVTTTPPANASTNITQIGGSTIALGQVLSAASFPVVIASDQSPLTTSAEGATGAAVPANAIAIGMEDGSGHLQNVSFGNPLPVTGTTTNSSIGADGASAPFGTTLVGGVGPGNSLQSISTDASGNVNVNIVTNPLTAALGVDGAPAPSGTYQIGGTDGFDVQAVYTDKLGRLRVVSEQSGDETGVTGSEEVPLQQIEGTNELAVYDTNLERVFATQPLRGPTNRIVVDPLPTDVTYTGFVTVKNQQYYVPCTGYATAVITVGGTWTGNVSFSCSAGGSGSSGGDPVQGLAAQAVSSTLTQVSSSTGSNGVWRCNITGMTRVGIIFSTATSGTPTITINLSQNPPNLLGGTVAVTGTATVGGNLVSLQQKGTTDELFVWDTGLATTFGTAGLLAEGQSPVIGTAYVGPWNSAVAYAPPNIVSYQGNYWQSVTGSTNQAPSITNDQNWSLAGPLSRLKVSVAGRDVGDPALRNNVDGTFQVAVQDRTLYSLLERLIRIGIDTNSLLLAIATSAGSNLADFNPIGETFGSGNTGA